MSSSSRRVWVSRCRRPTGWAGRAGQRDVDDVGDQPRVELGAVELGLARLERRLDAAPRLVGRLADAPALLRRQLGDAAQQLRQLGLAPEVLDAHALELLRGAGAVDGLRGRLLDLLDAVDHRETSYIATVAAMAALSDSERIGMWQTSSHPASTASGSPSRSAPTTSVTSPGVELGQRRALARHQRDAPAGQLGDLAHPHERHREQRAHRGPHRLVAVGIGRPRAERDAAGPEGERRAQHRPDVAGVVDAPQRDAQRADRRGRPALAVDRERARARAELGDLGQQRLGDLLAREPGARGHEPRRRLPARGVGGVEQVLALGHELAQLVAPLATRELADLREGLVVGAGDHRFGRKKRRPSCRRGARGFGVFGAQAEDASRALWAKRRKVSASRTAMSARTLRSSSMPASLRPCMKVE